MKEFIQVQKLYKKYYVTRCRGEALGKHYVLPSFANGIKNDKTSSEIHRILCLLKTE